jgi:hypothetical protein
MSIINDVVDGVTDLAQEAVGLATRVSDCFNLNASGLASTNSFGSPRLESVSSDRTFGQNKNPAMRHGR